MPSLSEGGRFVLNVIISRRLFVWRIIIPQWSSMLYWEWLSEAGYLYKGLSWVVYWNGTVWWNWMDPVPVNALCVELVEELAHYDHNHLCPQLAWNSGFELPSRDLRVDNGVPQLHQAWLRGRLVGRVLVCPGQQVVKYHRLCWCCSFSHLSSRLAVEFVRMVFMRRLEQCRGKQ
jgi:hypothetical protein